MWIWLMYLVCKDKWLNKCTEPVDMFAIIYLIIWGLFLVGCLLSVFGLLMMCLRPKQTSETKIGGGLYHDDDNVDFNPYN